VCATDGNSITGRRQWMLCYGEVLWLCCCGEFFMFGGVVALVQSLDLFPPYRYNRMDSVSVLGKRVRGVLNLRPHQLSRQHH